MKRMFFIAMIVAGPLSAGTLRLSEAQALLFKNNLDILTAEEEAAKAANELSVAWTGFYPSLDAIGSYNYLTAKNEIHIALPFPFPTIDKALGGNDKAECGLNLTYPLFTGFQRYYAVSAVKEALAVKEADVEAVKNRASLNLGMLYAQWELSYKQVDLKKKLVEQLETYANQLTAMQEAGTILKSKLLDARARLQLAKVDVVAAESQHDSLELELKSYLLLKKEAISPDTASQPFDTMPVPKSPRFKTRPEFLALDHATAQVEERRKALKFRHFPVISGIAGLRYGRPGLNMGKNAYMGYGLAGVQAQWNLFDGFKTRSEGELLMRQINFIEIERTRRTEFFSRSFELARQQMSNSCGRLLATESARDAAAALAADTKNSLEAGTVTSADYLSALVNVAQAELQVEQARTMKKIALLRLTYAAGVTIKF